MDFYYLNANISYYVNNVLFILQKFCILYVYIHKNTIYTRPINNWARSNRILKVFYIIYNHNVDRKFFNEKMTKHQQFCCDI